jgi:signal transduction histidine kinase
MVEDLAVDEAEKRKSLAGIKTAGRDLLELIENTLEVGKIDAGSVHVRFESVSLPALWAELADGCARIPRAPGVALEWSPTVPPIRLETDPRKLTVVVRNLVGNALKFTERGHVWVEAYCEDGSLLVRVSDTGIGIRREDQEAIFEMFRQADQSDTRRHGGSGLGLYIVRRFVEQLGGTVTVASAPGEGSVFTVALPCGVPVRAAA